VPTIAPIPTPTINNRKAYNSIIAIGFNRVFRDGRLSTFVIPGFGTLTVFTFTAPVWDGGNLPLVGIGFTIGGTTTRDRDFRPSFATAGGLILFMRVIATASLVVVAWG
jgi:hypothetical protein